MVPERNIHKRKPPSPVILMALAALFVIVPVLFWHGTWFGRSLSEEQTGEYLRDARRPRRVQHALSQVASRITNGDTSVRRWYPDVVAAARHPERAIRSTAAWVMGQDNTSELFHQALLGLLEDQDVMVRRNAALSLVRFRDAGGRPELVGMLKPYAVRAPASGRLTIQLRTGQRIGSGAKLASVRLADGSEVELRSPYAGEVGAVLARDGSGVASGDPIVLVDAGPDQVWEALRGLSLIGQPEDLAEIEALTGAGRGAPARVREQAVYTARAIRTRAEREASR